MKLARRGAASEASAEASERPRATDAALLAQRDRLTERFALMQSELGGVFYEMAIRDHVKMDVLIERAAGLQRVDAELAQVEHLLAQGGGVLGGNCEQCGAAHAVGAVFCAQCAHPVGS